MFASKNNTAKKEVEKLLDSVQMNLENNYKDLAISSRQMSEEKLEDYNQQGMLKSKDYQKLKERLDEFTKRMEGYSHRLNVRF